MFKKIFIEEGLEDSKYARNILSHFPDTETIKIDKYDSIWGKVKKPYLQKRDNLNLFIAKKRGQLIKEAPDAYGAKGAKHYYFIHAYNCIYECQYCFLQGYFHTPDIVFFINHEEIIKEIEKTILQESNAWFHAGEFSDSLALHHLTNELDDYFELFKKYPKAKLELRTKSVNLKQLKNTDVPSNVILSFSISPDKNSKLYDLKTPSSQARIRAIKTAQEQGIKIGLHLDPIIYSKSLKEDYFKLITHLKENIDLDQIEYVSIGVVRYTSDVYRQVELNYPDSGLHHQPHVKSFDNKVRYSRALRSWIFNTVEEIFTQYEFDTKKIYRCME